MPESAAKRRVDLAQPPAGERLVLQLVLHHPDCPSLAFGFAGGACRCVAPREITVNVNTTPAGADSPPPPHFSRRK